MGKLTTVSIMAWQQLTIRDKGSYFNFLCFFQATTYNKEQAMKKQFIIKVIILIFVSLLFLIAEVY